MDLNMDIQDVVELLRQSTAVRLAKWTYGVAALGATIVALISWVWFDRFYKPHNERETQLQEKLKTAETKAMELPQIRHNIGRMQQRIKKQAADYSHALARFYDDDALADAFEHLSKTAKRTHMTVLSVQKASLSKDLQNMLAPKDAFSLLHPRLLPIAIKVRGRYGDYLTFLDKMTAEPHLYVVTGENVTLSKDKHVPEHIEAELTLAAYALQHKTELQQTLATLLGQAANATAPP